MVIIKPEEAAHRNLDYTPKQSTKSNRVQLSVEIYMIPSQRKMSEISEDLQTVILFISVLQSGYFAEDAEPHVGLVL
jgi:hypothetical protein